MQRLVFRYGQRGPNPCSSTDVLPVTDPESDRDPANEALDFLKDVHRRLYAGKTIHKVEVIEFTGGGRDGFVSRNVDIDLKALNKELNGSEEEPEEEPEGEPEEDPA